MKTLWQKEKLLILIYFLFSKSSAAYASDCVNLKYGNGSSSNKHMTIPVWFPVLRSSLCYNAKPNYENDVKSAF